MKLKLIAQPKLERCSPALSTINSGSRVRKSPLFYEYPFFQKSEARHAQVISCKDIESILKNRVLIGPYLTAYYESYELMNLPRGCSWLGSIARDTLLKSDKEGMCLEKEGTLNMFMTR